MATTLINPTASGYRYKILAQMAQVPFRLHPFLRSYWQVLAAGAGETFFYKAVAADRLP